MESRGRALGPATTRFNDYMGTVAADDAEAVKERPSLYELARVDRTRYTIVGIDLKVDGPAAATVYAVDRIEHAVRRPSDSDSRGEIPFVPFDIPEPHVEDFIRHAFRRISVRLVKQDLLQQVLVVTESSPGEDLEA